MREQNTKEKLKLFCFGHIGADRLPPELFEALEKLKDEVELVIAGIDRYRDPEGKYSYSQLIEIDINFSSFFIKDSSSFLYSKLYLFNEGEFFSVNK